MGRILILVILAAAIAVGGYVYLGDAGSGSSAAQSQAQRPAIPVEMMVVNVETYVEQEGAVGSLASDEAVIIRSEIAGRVEDIGFEVVSQLIRATSLSLLMTAFTALSSIKLRPG